MIIFKSEIFSCHSSRGEGCSNAILEAMFSGLPIIATDTGRTSEIVKDTFGFLFPYQDHISLSCKIISLTDNPGLRKTMGEKAFEYANDNFLPKKMIENYYKIITKITTTPISYGHIHFAVLKDESRDDHGFWIGSLEEMNYSYDVIELTHSDWLEEVMKSPADIFLARPPGITFSTKIFTMNGYTLLLMY
ncbi:MAG: glycosyltransferase [Comamonadaceae bacterium]|nr:glycosyltransferase [Comamonadaceae bacterium]